MMLLVCHYHPLGIPYLALACCRRFCCLPYEASSSTARYSFEAAPEAGLTTTTLEQLTESTVSLRQLHCAVHWRRRGNHRRGGAAPSGTLTRVARAAVEVSRAMRRNVASRDPTLCSGRVCPLGTRPLQPAKRAGTSRTVPRARAKPYATNLGVHMLPSAGPRATKNRPKSCFFATRLN